MASSNPRTLLPLFSTALKNLTSSSTFFSIVHSIPTPPSATGSTSTLYILDSSFNPPTTAHLSICTSALLSSLSETPSSIPSLPKRSPTPASQPRLLLLLATRNADKAPQPAPYAHRMVLMSLLAQSIRASPGLSDVPIDIGLTSEPYFHNKSAAIEDSGTYARDTRQTWLIGYDTLLRLLDPKYYPPEHSLGVLDGFLGRHGVRIVLRTGGGWGGRQEQEKYLKGLEEGELEKLGGRREWSERMEVVEGRGEGEEPVSSSGVRERIREGDGRWKSWCTDRVAEWVEAEGLYTSEAKEENSGNG